MHFFFLITTFTYKSFIISQTQLFFHAQINKASYRISAESLVDNNNRESSKNRAIQGTRSIHLDRAQIGQTLPCYCHSLALGVDHDQSFSLKQFLPRILTCEVLLYFLTH